MDHVIDPLKAKRSPKKAYKNSHEYILDFKSLKVVDKIVDDVEKAKKKGNNAACTRNRGPINWFAIFNWLGTKYEAREAHSHVLAKIGYFLVNTKYQK